MGKLKDFTGQTCGCWQVIERDMNPTSKSHETFWKCICTRCGTPASVRKTDLDRKPLACNKCKGEFISETMRKNDNSVWQIGDRYDLLTIIDFGKTNNHHTYVKVQCDCGSEPFNVRLEHLKGQNRNGRTCSCGCLSESGGELKIRQLLEQYNIDFQKQYRIKYNNATMIFDFVIFKNNEIIAAIEYNGEQHYHPIDFFGGEEAFIKQQERDNRKTEYCNTHGINLIWIPYTDYDLISPDYPKLKNFLV